MPITSRFVVRSVVALFAIGLVALAVIVGTTIWLGERAQVYFDDVIAARDVRAAAVDVRNAVQTAESSQRGYILTGNQVYLAPYGTAKAQANRRFDALKRGLTDYPELSAAIERLSTVLADKIAEMDTSIALKRDRKDAEVLAAIRTNRGKLLMDEANVFFSGVVLAADGRLTTGVEEQRQNASWLRLVSTIGGAIILLVVAAAIITIYRYTQEIRQARDAFGALNADLEGRVARRTADLAKAHDDMRVARDMAEVLLSEVNHRVANSLALVSSMVGLQANAVKDSPAARDALNETKTRIYAISLVHKRLYSSGDARAVALDEYLAGLLDQLRGTLDVGKGVTIEYELAPLTLVTDASINLGVVVTEWVTNAVKYAYPQGGGTVRVRLADMGDGRGKLTVEDDGVGRSEDVPAQGTGVGTRIVKAMGMSLGGEITYHDRHPGTGAEVIFPLAARQPSGI